MNWRPIDLAPRDGTEIVVLFRSSLTGAVSAAVVGWKSKAWRSPSDQDVAETLGDVAFAWTDLPEDILGE